MDKKKWLSQIIVILMMVSLCLSSCTGKQLSPADPQSSTDSTVDNSSDGITDNTADPSSDSTTDHPRINWARFLLPDTPVLQLHCMEGKGRVYNIQSAGDGLFGLLYESGGDNYDENEWKSSFCVVDVNKDEIVLESDNVSSGVFLGVRPNGEYLFLDYEKSKYQIYDQNLNYQSSLDYESGTASYDRDDDCIYCIEMNEIKQMSFDGTEQTLVSLDPRAEITFFDPKQQLAVVRGDGIDEIAVNEYSIYSLQNQDYIYSEPMEYAQYYLKDRQLICMHGYEEDSYITVEDPFFNQDHIDYHFSIFDYTDIIKNSGYAVSIQQPEIPETVMDEDMNPTDSEESDGSVGDTVWDTGDYGDDSNDYGEDVDNNWNNQEYYGEDWDGYGDAPMDEYDGDGWINPESKYLFLDILNGRSLDMTSYLSGSDYTFQAYSDDLNCVLISGCTVRTDKNVLLLINPDKVENWEELPTGTYEKEQPKTYTVGKKLEEARAHADRLEEQYGVRILIGNECLNVASNGFYDFITTEAEDYEQIEWSLDTDVALDELEQALSYYSKDFFETFRNYRGEGGLRFLLVEDFTNPDGSFVPGGLFYDSGAWYNLMIDVDMLSDGDVVHHEMWHAVEQRVSDENYQAFDQEEWNQLNPPGFHYSEDFDNYFYEDENFDYLIPWYGEDEDNPDSVYFVEIYSTTTGYEDRATIMAAYLMSRYDPDVYGFATAKERIEHYPHLKAKLDCMAGYVRDVFGDVYWE